MQNPPHPFSFRDFRLFWIARLATTLAQNGMVVVIGWQVYDIARASMAPRDAALWLGLIGLAQFLPLFALTLVTGWAADRLDRRVIVRLCLGAQLICAAALGTLTHAGQMSLTPLFVVAIVLGIARAFYAPAQNALGPNLVPREILPRAIALGAIASRSGAIAGPAVGGYLYALAPFAPYAFDALLFALAFFCVMLIRPVAVTAMSRQLHPWRQMLEGLHYIRRNRVVLGAISLDLFAVLLGGATAMLPIYARDILHVGAAGLGALRAAPAVGALVSALWFTYRPLRSDIGVKMLMAVAIYGVATVVFGLSRMMPLSLICLAVLGAADMLSVYVRQSLIQMSTPDEMRGRVGAVSTMFVSASNELGEAESGFLAALIGPVAAVVLGGGGAVVMAVLWARAFPELREARNFDLPK
ncbi:MFS transporter [Solimonas marina]|uniref:MFS transporter n=1 Tax=Solimonas marina TaxID=2714601 RepID=UPI0019D10E71